MLEKISLDPDGVAVSRQAAYGQTHQFIVFSH